jgi:hypothetical protein
MAAQPEGNRVTLRPWIGSGGGVSVVADPGDEMAVGAGRGRMRASHADREQVIDTLKTAFVHGRLTMDELDARTGWALAARTYADLAPLTADIPSAPAPARPARPPSPARRRPLARAAAKSGVCLVIASAAMGFAGLFDPDGPGPDSWGSAMIALAACAVWTALGIMAYAVFAAWDERSRCRQLPPWPGPGDQALEAEQAGGVGHGPVPSGRRTDQTRANPRTHGSWPHRSPSSANPEPCPV